MPLQPNHIFRLSILLSLLYHVLLFCSFTFIFPLKKSSHKPKFVFIGSILQRNTLTETNKKKIPKIHILKSSQKIFQIKPESRNKATAHFSTTKPSRNNVPHTRKIILKSNFFTSNSPNSEKTSESNQIKTFISPSPFNPLKLENDD